MYFAIKVHILWDTLMSIALKCIYCVEQVNVYCCEMYRFVSHSNCKGTALQMKTAYVSINRAAEIAGKVSQRINEANG